MWFIVSGIVTSYCGIFSFKNMKDVRNRVPTFVSRLDIRILEE